MTRSSRSSARRPRGHRYDRGVGRIDHPRVRRRARSSCPCCRPPAPGTCGSRRRAGVGLRRRSRARRERGGVELALVRAAGGGDENPNDALVELVGVRRARADDRRRWPGRAARDRRGPDHHEHTKQNSSHCCSPCCALSIHRTHLGLQLPVLVLETCRLLPRHRLVVEGRSRSPPLHPGDATSWRTGTAEQSRSGSRSDSRRCRSSGR